MREKFEAAMISRRRAFWILGLGAAFGLGMPVAVLTAPDAEAQTPGTAKTPETAKTPGRPRRGRPGRSVARTGVPVAMSDVRTGVPVAMIDARTAAVPMGRRKSSLRCP